MMSRFEQLRDGLTTLLAGVESMIDFYGGHTDPETTTVVRDLVRVCEYLESALAETKGKE